MRGAGACLILIRVIVLQDRISILADEFVGGDDEGVRVWDEI